MPIKCKGKDGLAAYGYNLEVSNKKLKEIINRKSEGIFEN
jgi:hypothetical protein